MRSRMWTCALAAAAGAVLAAGAAWAASFPDVPPWHWAYDAITRDEAAGLIIGYPVAPADLIENSLTQVYDGFGHSGARGAQGWVERFTYNRPADWPAPFAHSQVAAFLLSGMRITVRGDVATAQFSAAVTTRDGKTSTSQMRVQMRLSKPDWQVDYGTLTATSPVFR
jgi:hypothetical protein